MWLDRRDPGPVQGPRWSIASAGLTGTVGFVPVRGAR
jgi:hypothetical protein